MVPSGLRGYGAFMVWETRIGSTALFGIEDGWFHAYPTEWFPESDANVWQSHSNYLTPDGRLRLSMGCFLFGNYIRE